MNNDNLITSKLIIASAGSGKTYQLTRRILALLDQGVEPQEILATTFTKKAAGEIEARIYETLLKEYKEANGQPKQQKGELIKKLICGTDSLKINTLDSFFIEIAKCFHEKLGLNSGYSIIENSREIELKIETLLEYIFSQETETTHKLLTQLKSDHKVLKGLEELKRVADQELDRLIENDHVQWGLEGILPVDDAIHVNGVFTTEKENYYITSFTELVRNNLLPLTAKGIPNKNFSDAVNRIIELIRSRQYNKLESSILSVFIVKGTYYGIAFTSELSLLLHELAKDLKSILITAINSRTNSYQVLLADFYESLLQAKINTGAVSFTDIKNLICKSEISREFSELYLRLDSRISHILFDEFQDTSILEWQILKPLIDETVLKETDGTRKSFFCVGDPKQSIYGWRGGESTLINLIQKLYGEFINKSDLNDTRRCSQAVVEFVNVIFSSLDQLNCLHEYPDSTARFGLNFKPHGTLSGQPGYVRITQLQKRQGNPLAVENESGNDEESEASSYIEFPENYKEAEKTLKEILSKDPGAKIGVLFKGNAAIESFAEFLKAVNFPYEFSNESSTGINYSPELAVLEAVLKLIDHQPDSIAGFIVGNYKFNATEDFSPGNSEKFVAACKNIIFCEGFPYFITKLVNSIYLQRSEEADWIITAGYQFAKLFKARAYDFFAFLIHSKRSISQTNQQIRLLTIHSSKGLEFQNVILPEIDSQILYGHYQSKIIQGFTRDGKLVAMSYPGSLAKLLVPEIRDIDNSAASIHVFESLCALYVAVTRTIENLYIICKSADSGKLSLETIINQGLPLSGKTPLATDDLIVWEFGTAPQQAVAVTGEQESDPVKQAGKLQDNPASGRTALIELAPERSKSIIHETPSGSEKSASLIISRYHSLDIKGAQLGTRIHRELQLLKWIGETTGAGLERSSDKLREYLEKPEVSRILSKDYYWGLYPEIEELHVYTERGFSLISDSQADARSSRLITGSFDRVIYGTNAAGIGFIEIIDYKTDKIPAAKAADRAGQYKHQCDIYKWAAGEIFKTPTDKIKVKLLFLEPGVIYEAI